MGKDKIEKSGPRREEPNIIQDYNGYLQSVHDLRENIRDRRTRQLPGEIADELFNHGVPYGDTEVGQIVDNDKD